MYPHTPNARPSKCLHLEGSHLKEEPLVRVYEWSNVLDVSVSLVKADLMVPHKVHQNAADRPAYTGDAMDEDPALNLLNVGEEGGGGVKVLEDVVPGVVHCVYLHVREGVWEEVLELLARVQDVGYAVLRKHLLVVRLVPPAESYAVRDEGEATELLLPTNVVNAAAGERTVVYLGTRVALDCGPGLTATLGFHGTSLGAHS